MKEIINFLQENTEDATYIECSDGTKLIKFRVDGSIFEIDITNCKSLNRFKKLVNDKQKDNLKLDFEYHKKMMECYQKELEENYTVFEIDEKI